ncbi:hypothetical protein DDE05_59735 [Streptomyces cavourensis]|nr:hypothetical protein DDE05_59735 [Streptomyces cavourensis]
MSKLASGGENKNVNINITFSGNRFSFPGGVVAHAGKLHAGMSGTLVCGVTGAVLDMVSQLMESLDFVNSERPRSGPISAARGGAATMGGNNAAAGEAAKRADAPPVVGVDDLDSSSSAKATGRQSITAEIKQCVRRNTSPQVVDKLFDRASRPGADGREAMALLFGLYTETEAAVNSEFRERLRQRGLEMMDSLIDRGPEPGRIDASLPLKFLIMLGFACENGSAARERTGKELSKALSKTANVDLFRSAFQDDDTFSNLLADDRMVTANELNACAAKLGQPSGLVRFEHARGDSGSEQMFPSLRSDDASIYAQPICIRRHWVLFGIDIRSPEKPRAFLFDSENYLNNGDCEELLGAAKKRLGVAALPLDLVAENLQRNATNACGVFVADAITELARLKPQQSPGVSLANYAEDFLRRDPCEQQALARRGRARLYGDVLDSEFFRTPAADS